jgi:hypothetical protein
MDNPCAFEEWLTKVIDRSKRVKVREVGDKV